MSIDFKMGGEILAEVIHGGSHLFVLRSAIKRLRHRYQGLMKKDIHLIDGHFFYP